MGSGSSKFRVDLEVLDSPIYKETKKEYGEKIMDVELEWIGRHGLGVTFTVTTLNRVKDSLEECESKLRDEGKLKHQHKAKFLTHKKVTSFCLEEEYKNELQMKCQLRKTREEVILLQNLLRILLENCSTRCITTSTPGHTTNHPHRSGHQHRHSTETKLKKQLPHPHRHPRQSETKIVWSKWGMSRGWEGGPGGWTQ